VPPLRFLVVTLGISACSEVAAVEVAPREQPSIVLVSIDTLSARHTSLHGYPRATTPGLERLAESSIVFERAWANAPWTTPSFMSQFTGLLASSLRRPYEVADDESAWALAEEHVTLAEALAAAGYRTAAFVDNWNVRPELGFGQGFEVYDTSAAEIGLEDPSGGIEHVSALALGWLDGLRAEERFFLFLQVLDVHGPYLAGLAAEDVLRSIAAQPSDVEDRRVPVALEHDAILGAIPLYVAEPLVEEDGDGALAVRPLVDAYDAGIRVTDAALERFVEALAGRGLLERTVLVVTADHGESLVEHDSYFDHQLLHGEELHVPLLVRPAGGTAGRRIGTDVQLVDLYPTLAELAGTDAPPGHGRSLAPALRGEALEPAPVAAAGDFLGSRSILVDGWKLLETSPSPANAGLTGYLTTPRARVWIGTRFPELAGQVFGTHELPPAALEGADVGALHAQSRDVLGGPFRSLYHLASDPGERVDRAREEPERLRALLEALDVLDARARRLPGRRGRAARRQDARAARGARVRRRRLRETAAPFLPRSGETTEGGQP
jgi:arylsulfatase A-like enzyme